MLDLLLAVIGAADQHVAQMVEPFAQALGKTHDPGDAALQQHVEVQRDLAFQLGQPEQRLHHQFRIDGARLRLDHEADVLGRFVADVADQRQLLLVQSSAIFSTRRDFCTSHGISVMTTTQVPRAPSSWLQRARVRNEPRPVV